jgi:Tol biopolymer transport system component
VRSPEAKADAGVANLHLLSDKASVMFMGWSPDGSLALVGKIVRDHLINNVVSLSLSELWIVDANGEIRMKVSDAAGVGTWSPDGQQVLFTEPVDSKGGGDANLLVADVISGQIQPIATGDLASGLIPNIEWLPTGHIFFGHGTSLYRVDPDGTNLSSANSLQFTPLVDKEESQDRFRGGHISVCPDESKIAYTLPQKDAPWISELWIANGDGTNAVRVIDSVPDFAWKPDCTQLAFTHIRKYEGSGYESSIMLVDRDGQNMKEIVPASQSDETNQFPQWTSSGQWIVYTKRVPYFDSHGWWLEYQIWKVDPNTRKGTLLIEHGGPKPYLSTDDQRLAFNAQVEPDVLNAYVAEIDLNH